MSKGIDFTRLMCSFEDRNIVQALSCVTHENVMNLDPQGDCVLVYLCWVGPDDPDLLRHFIKLGASLSASKGFTPFQMAARENKPKLLRALLDYSDAANYMNLRTTHHYTSPIEFCCNGQDKIECAKILIDAGAKLPKQKHIGVVLDVVLQNFIETRRTTRSAAIMILGLKRCRSSVLGGGNGGDILRVIARCVWSTRGLVTKKVK